MNISEQIKQLEVNICMALKNKKVESAERDWQSLMIIGGIQEKEKNSSVEVALVSAMKNLLNFAVRTHNYEFFGMWLMPAWSLIRCFPFPADLAKFVTSIGFAVADRNIDSYLGKVQVIFTQYIRICRFFCYKFDDILHEWQGVSEEICSRGDSPGARLVVNCLAKALYYTKDVDLLQTILWKLHLQMQFAIQKYGFADGAKLYKKIYCWELIFSEKVKKLENESDKDKAEGILYCSIRNRISNLAKCNACEETDVIENWRFFMTDGASSKLIRRFDEFLDRELKYWQKTRPISYARIKEKFIEN